MLTEDKTNKMRQIVLNNDQTASATGIIIPGGIDTFDYTIKDGNKIEVYTESGAKSVLELLPNDENLENITLIGDGYKEEIKVEE